MPDVTYLGTSRITFCFQGKPTRVTPHSVFLSNPANLAAGQTINGTRGLPGPDVGDSLSLPYPGARGQRDDGNHPGETAVLTYRREVNPRCSGLTELA